MKIVAVFAHEDTKNFIFAKYVLFLYRIFTVCEHGLSKLTYK